MPKISVLQADHGVWAKRNFPNQTWEEILMGVTEEVGELNHHLLKQKQGIRGTFSEHEAGAKDSIGDIIVYLTHLCTLREWDLEDIISTTFSTVLRRDWTEDKLLGKSATKAIQGQE